MANTTTSVKNPTEERALKLLGSGLSVESVAAAVGVSPSRISQLLSDPIFSSAVSELRFNSLSKHNERDASYDSIEDDLLQRLKQSIPMLMRPMEITKVLATINAAKRRGQSSSDAIHNQQTVVSIVLPTAITSKFSVNINNQVTSAGSQELITIQASELKTMASDKMRTIENINDENKSTRNPSD